MIYSYNNDLIWFSCSLEAPPSK